MYYYYVVLICITSLHLSFFAKYIPKNVFVHCINCFQQQQKCTDNAEKLTKLTVYHSRH